MSVYKEYYKGIRYHQKHKPPLRIKIAKILSNYGLPKCQLALHKLNSFNLKILENKQSLPYVQTKVRQSRKFTYSSEPSPLKHYMNLDGFVPNYEKVTNNLLKELTPDEIQIIKKNKDYYIKDKAIKDNIKIFDFEPLYERLIEEDNDGSRKGYSMGNSFKDKSSTKNSFHEGTKIVKDDEYKAFESLIKNEIIKDKKRNIEMESKKKNIDITLNKIYIQSKVELANIDKEIKKLYYPLNREALLKQSELLEGKIVNTEQNEKELLDKKIKNKNMLYKNKGEVKEDKDKNEQMIAKIQRKIKEIYEEKKELAKLPKVK